MHTFLVTERLLEGAGSVGRELGEELFATLRFGFFADAIGSERETFQ